MNEHQDQPECRMPCLPEEEPEMCAGCALAFWAPEETAAEEPERSEAA